MATAPIKSQPLHNFNFPFLKWGTHGGGSSSAATADHSRSPESDSDHDRLRPTRVGSRSTRIHRSSFPPPPKAIKQSHREEEQRKQREEESSKPRENEAEEDEEETVQRPWNLRPRKVVMETSAAVVTSAAEKTSETVGPKSMRLRGFAENGGVAEKKEKRKFWIALSKEEIEEDIFVITGSRPARRPKKRPKNIQKQLDNVFPGLWLVGTTADAYRIADAPVKGMDMVLVNLQIWELCRGMAHLRPQFFCGIMKI
ncbi:hypothetical protein F383_19218 [Gossypium arboreum]|uniref:Uncharacterized protein n=1 Tax=Gossypium arboreum TaxID=29729 RepID=A0A0B0M9X4_GOSAR|nr:hypothetical protein F383_19218 [Gossypium arboreum]